ncbi:MAG: hypothetical protein K2L77_03545, partial [Muribaculaceae bacterium]|nr:hypothetical protein [Muribaculaceae bacterium]
MSSTNHTRRRNVINQPKRKLRRRVHKGRLAFVLSVLALVVVGIAVMLSRCSDRSLIGGDSDLHRPAADAVRTGREDARKVMQTAPQSMEREEALLFIRSRENELRKAGYAHAADDYIEAAVDELKNVTRFNF